MIVRVVEYLGLTGKIYKTEIGYYHKIFYKKKVIAQMCYYSNTFETARDNMFKAMENIDLKKLEK